MKNKEQIQYYINNFRRHFSKYLKSGIGISSSSHPTLDGGAIIIFKFERGALVKDKIESISRNVNGALSTIHTSSFDKNISNIHFGGTNLILEKDRIIIIKGEDDPKQWSDKAAKSDVERIVFSGMEKHR